MKRCIFGCDDNSFVLCRFPIHDPRRCENWLKFFKVHEDYVRNRGGLANLRVCLKHFHQQNQMIKSKFKANNNGGRPLAATIGQTTDKLTNVTRPNTCTTITTTTTTTTQSHDMPRDNNSYTVVSPSSSLSSSSSSALSSSSSSSSSSLSSSLSSSSDDDNNNNNNNNNAINVAKSKTNHKNIALQQQQQQQHEQVKKRVAVEKEDGKKEQSVSMPSQLRSSRLKVDAEQVLRDENNSTIVHNRKIYIITETLPTTRMSPPSPSLSQQNMSGNDDVADDADADGGDGDGDDRIGSGRSIAGRKRKMYLVVDEVSAASVEEQQQHQQQQQQQPQQQQQQQQPPNDKRAKKITLFTNRTNGPAATHDIERVMPEILRCISNNASNNRAPGRPSVVVLPQKVPAANVVSSSPVSWSPPPPPQPPPPPPPPSSSSSSSSTLSDGCNVGQQHVHAIPSSAMNGVTVKSQRQPLSSSSSSAVVAATTTTTTTTAATSTMTAAVTTASAVRSPVMLPPKKDRIKVINSILGSGQRFSASPTNGSGGSGSGSSATPVTLAAMPERPDSSTVDMAPRHILTTKNMNLSADFIFLIKMLPKLEVIPEPHKDYVKQCIQNILNDP